MRVRNLKPDEMKYALGTLMYCPGDNEKVADKLIENKFPDLNVMVLCLEDAILLQNLGHAEDILEETLTKVKVAYRNNPTMDLPLIFIRVRNPQHLEHCLTRYHKFSSILNGFVMPKYDSTVSEQYKRIINGTNNYHKFKFMPILESAVLIEAANRKKELLNIKADLENTKGILGVLVGSNDMCNYFALRRSAYQTVYDIGVIKDILSDIICVMGRDYVVNGPIWEYFDGDNWEEGLRREVELDQLNGFIGKSCVHPKQLSVIRDAIKVNKLDYEDAVEIINWDSEHGVIKGKNSGRMNEVATHQAWAEKVYTLGKIYGVKGE